MSAAARPRLDILYDGPGLAGCLTSMEVVADCLGAAPPTIEFTPAKARIVRFTSITDELEIRVHGLSGAVSQTKKRAELCALASAIVFVADSIKERLESNAWHCKELEALIGNTKPVVLQLNKRDLAARGYATPVAELSRAINLFRAPVYESIAPKGTGVWEAFVAAAILGARARDLEAVAAPVLATRLCPIWVRAKRWLSARTRRR